MSEELELPVASPPAERAKTTRVSLLLAPSTVRPDGVNPRDFEKLDTKSCKELMEMIAAVGQLAPVLVRPLADDPQYEYQLVYGARRLWSVLELNRLGHDIKLIAEVDALNDQEAARAADAENRGRLGISAYERGVFLKHQLDRVYGGKQSTLAEAMNLDTALVSRLLNLAEWPDELLKAFGDARQVTLEDVTVLNKFVGEADDADAVEQHQATLLAEAGKLADEQADLQQKGRALLRRTEVRARLLASVEPTIGSRKIPDETGNAMLLVRPPTRAGVSLYLSEKDERLRQSIVDAMVEAALSVRRKRDAKRHRLKVQG